LTRRFDTVLAVDAIDLSIEHGTIFGLLGPNGAG
jgi:ABC-2 type transport system ATP-binding protein